MNSKITAITALIVFIITMMITACALVRTQSNDDAQNVSNPVDQIVSAGLRVGVALFIDNNPKYAGQIVNGTDELITKVKDGKITPPEGMTYTHAVALEAMTMAEGHEKQALINYVITEVEWLVNQYIKQYEVKLDKRPEVIITFLRRVRNIAMIYEDNEKTYGEMEWGFDRRGFERELDAVLDKGHKENS